MDSARRGRCRRGAGRGLAAWHHFLGKERVSKTEDSQQGSFLGPSFSNDDIGVFLDSVGASYERIDVESTLLDRVAHLLTEEKIVGWFHGRMEYGPRSLGCRSIIGDARSPDMQQVMNLKIKFRESFRPFAPCVLKEFADCYFEMQPNDGSPYMLFVAPVRESLRSRLTHKDLQKMQDPDLRIRVSVPRSNIPAVTHVDYSARIQTVDSARHGRFYRLMRRFYELTECPVLVNTSFNIRGEPIVCSFEEAYRCFMASNLDCLVLENYFLMKKSQPCVSLQDTEAYIAQFAAD